MIGAKFQEKIAGQFKDAGDRASNGLLVLMGACLLLLVSTAMLYSAVRARGDR